MSATLAERAAQDRVALKELARLYATLLELRERRGRDEEKPADARFRALAGELPGALRILDQMPLDALSLRAAELARVAAGETLPPPWVESTLAWQSVMRVALAIRRAAGRERSLERAREVLAGRAPAHHATTTDDLEAIVRPEDGRLVVWALCRVGASVGRPPDAVEREVFGVVPVSALTRSAAPTAPAPTRSRTHR